MSVEFINYKIENIGDVKSGKRLPKGHTLRDTKSNYPYIRLVDVEHGKVQPEKLQYLSEETQNQIKRYIVNERDVCLAIVGHTIGMVFYIESKFDNVNLTENAARITNLKPEFNSRYLYYYLTSSLGQHKILSRKVGSAQGKLPLYNIRSMEIPFPEKHIQNKVVSTLDSLDDKIELNRQMNKTLEAMAQAIFKSWFVDFDPVHAKANAIANGQDSEAVIQAAMEAIAGSNPEINSTLGADPEKLRYIASLFPSEFVESELGLIPKGWEVKDAQEIAMINIGKTPPRKEKQWFSTSTSDMKWISIRDMGKSGVFAFDSAECLTHKSLNKFNVKTVPENTVLLSFKLTLGRVTITTEEMATNEAIAHFTKSKLSASYLYCYLKLFNYESLGSTSSIATAVNSKTIKSMPILNPDQKTTEVFNELVKPLFDNIKNISKESLNLSKLRDTLLPKLLSGELSVENTKSEMEMV